MRRDPLPGAPKYAAPAFRPIRMSDLPTELAWFWEGRWAVYEALARGAPLKLSRLVEPDVIAILSCPPFIPEQVIAGTTAHSYVLRTLEAL